MVLKGYGLTLGEVALAGVVMYGVATPMVRVTRARMHDEARGPTLRTERKGASARDILGVVWVNSSCTLDSGECRRQSCASVFWAAGVGIGADGRVLARGAKGSVARRSLYGR
eukprot:940025-Alexandrium_andersonii.AAC.1